MAETVDIGPLFFHCINLRPEAPVWHRAPTQEVDEPFRAANSHVIRLWPSTRALVTGWWRDSGLDEDEALHKAVHIPGHDGRIAAGWGVVTDDDGNLMEDPDAR